MKWMDRHPWWVLGLLSRVGSCTCLDLLCSSWLLNSSMDTQCINLIIGKNAWAHVCKLKQSSEPSAPLCWINNFCDWPRCLDTLVTILVVARVEFCNGLVDAHGISQGLAENGQSAQKFTSHVYWAAFGTHWYRLPITQGHPPGLEALVTNLVPLQMEFPDCLVDAQGISQGLQRGGKPNGPTNHKMSGVDKPRFECQKGAVRPKNYLGASWFK